MTEFLSVAVMIVSLSLVCLTAVGMIREAGWLIGAGSFLGFCAFVAAILAVSNAVPGFAGVVIFASLAIAVLARTACVFFDSPLR